ncbi:hypothetical protein HPB48_006300 [Haemaphysalis longicornis]|uniref:ATP-dependent DNA helicase n=1 Tax=Haemaphysalis longicornis TaxID=44386 RepID=A0A9J6G7D2_HAELO|nr:hypothetical protein HPB48_006300 [Haemaphysalis longicornis]
MNYDDDVRHGDLNTFRLAFANVRLLVIDAVSMMGSALLAMVDIRMHQIKYCFDEPFGGMDVLLCDELHQLPPVRATEIYKSRKKQIRMQTDMPWQYFGYNLFVQTMHQKEVLFSSLLTKIGDGDRRSAMLQSLCASSAAAHNLCPRSVWLFNSNNDADTYNTSLVTGDASVVVSNADDIMIGHKSQNQFDDAKASLATMNVCGAGSLPAQTSLCVGNSYMLTANVDVTDELVKGVIGLLRYIQHDTEENKMARLCLVFPSEATGRVVRIKAAPVRTAFSDISAM